MSIQETGNINVTFLWLLPKPYFSHFLLLVKAVLLSVCRSNLEDAFSQRTPAGFFSLWSCERLKSREGVLQNQDGKVVNPRKKQSSIRHLGEGLQWLLWMYSFSLPSKVHTHTLACITSCLIRLLLLAHLDHYNYA